MKHLLITTAVVVGIAGFLIVARDSAYDTSLSAVSYGSEYNATSTTAAGTKCVKLGGGTLGSITVSSTTVGTFTILNATSTTDAASTTIAAFGASASFGTYAFDAVFDRGLCVRGETGFNGVYTTTWR